MLYLEGRCLRFGNGLWGQSSACRNFLFLLCPLQLLPVKSSIHTESITRKVCALLRASTTVGFWWALPCWRNLPKNFSRGSWVILWLRNSLVPGILNMIGRSSKNDETAWSKCTKMYSIIMYPCQLCIILYSGKFSQGPIFTVFAGDRPIVKLTHGNKLDCTVHKRCECACQLNPRNGKGQPCTKISCYMYTKG